MAPTHEGLPVYLHVYDVSNEMNIQLLNKFFAHKEAPFKFGGVFHAAIEVGGEEWTFGYVSHGTGVNSRFPRSDPHHHFRETVRLPNTSLCAGEVEKVIDNLCREFRGNTYSLLGRNCCHFAEEFCQLLGVGCLPAWVHRWHRVGDSMRMVSQSFERGIGVLCPTSECTAIRSCAREKISVKDGKDALAAGIRII